MATKDNSPGLLSKVARFVRNPTKDWTELDQREPEADSGYSKRALKEMIERKRQNDFVRRREFDHLRKLRSRDRVGGPENPGRPSFFQSSLPSKEDDRASTLRKIDEIEAQMSRQWWKGKQDDGAVLDSSFPVSSKMPLPMPPIAARPAAAQGEFTSTESSRLEPGAPAPGADFVPTEMGTATAPPGKAPAPGAMAAPRPMPAPTPAAKSKLKKSFVPSRGLGGDSAFSSSKLFSIEMGDYLADPDLEEAAIRFANGDDVGAEAGLLHALRGDNLREDAAQAWASALFDLYRATGQQDRFDDVAIDYAERFGRSAPAWFSMPEQLGSVQDAPQSAPPRAATVVAYTWQSPAALDAAAVAELEGALEQSATPWRIDWGALHSIAVDGVQALAALFESWCAQPVQLHFDGIASLEQTLRLQTPSGDREVDPRYWALRMDALRILHLHDEFELAALDYCVTYEVSPPSWQDARCTLVQLAAEPADAAASRSAQLLGAPVWSNGPAQSATTVLSFDDSDVSVVELSGEILGDAAQTLEQLQAGAQGAQRLVVSCARLIRVDFSAAGSILNWVAMQQSKGCQVQFREVHQLVGAFFSVIGINEHARVILRCS